MERIAALLVRWGTAATVLVIVGSFVGFGWLTGGAEDAQTDSIGVGLGAVLMICVAVIISASLAGVGALGLWYAAAFSPRPRDDRYGNERVIGSALLIVASLVAALMWRAF